MGFSDLFKPKWKHSNPDVRADAVRSLGDDEAALLANIARSDADARVRRIATSSRRGANVALIAVSPEPTQPTAVPE